MTAEIAVLNKSAIALAADSAVTIGRGATAKIYNTVNKIFELSKAHPVAIMIYGRLDFMGMPLETVIKQYRAELKERSFTHISGYRDDFLSYLGQKVPVRPEDEDSNFRLIMYSSFKTIADETRRRLFEDMDIHGKYRAGKVNAMATDVIDEFTTKLQSKPFLPGAKRAKIPTSLVAAVDSVALVALREFQPSKSTLECARKYAAHFITRSSLSDFRSGIVVAGFGDAEWCPSLEAVEIDGIISGKLKSVPYKSIDVTRGGVEADIVGFAQDDMVQTFLHGIDPLLKEYFLDIIGSAIKDTAERVISHVVKSPATVSSTLGALAPDFDSMRADLMKGADDYIEKASTSQIRDMVRAMPKQELVNLASSLIEITSLKRRVSRAQESVGGEVDVAIISKSEGFVWTKRKHYFPRELNPRFFARHFN